MNNEELRKLINRELDGRIAPEEEAILMDEVSRDPELEREYRAQHALRAGFRSMERPLPPHGLADRITDSVLAASPRNLCLSWSYPLLRTAATLLAVLTVGITAGYFLRGENVVVATPEPGAASKIVNLEGWKSILGLNEEQTHAWRETLARYEREYNSTNQDDKRALQVLDDRLHSDRLRLLTLPQQRSKYAEHVGLSAQEVLSLLRLHDGR